MHKLNRLRRVPRRHTLRCGYCGKFIPAACGFAYYDSWNGVQGYCWDCPHCGRLDGTI